jgi:hypothetical protein
MLIKLNTWLCLETRKQDEVTVCRLIIVPLKWWKISNNLEKIIKNQNSIQEETKSRLKSEIACYNSVQSLLSSSVLPKI